MAVDIDMHEGVNGLANFQRLAQRLGPLPTTVAQRSISGKGFHGILKAPGCEIHKNITGVLGVDFLYHHYIVLNQVDARTVTVGD